MGFLLDPPEERASLVGQTIADYDARYTAFARTGNLRLPKTSWTPALPSRTETSSTACRARVTFSKRYSFGLHVFFNSDEFDPSELL
jgi:hypothetical protein